MNLAYIIVTRNRRAAVMRTIGRLEQMIDASDQDAQIWVVDNASSDGTCEALAAEHREVQVIRRRRNEGVSARNHAITAADADYLVLLDDDSYPTGDSIERSTAYLDQHPRTAAVVGRIVLPTGELEACALPNVLLSGAVCIRKSVLNEVGGFGREFFRKAGEYDLSFRIWQAGYSIERFEDIVYRHDKVMLGRNPGLAHRMDIRNNLILAERYLPTQLRREYRADWHHRYMALARHARQATAARRGLIEARGWALSEALHGRNVLNPAVLQIAFQLDCQARLVAGWAGENRVRHVIIADYGKNVYATWRAAQLAKLNVVAVADRHPSFAGMHYRGVGIVPDREAARYAVDSIIISNINPAHVAARYEQLRQIFDGPILRLWHPQYLTPPSMRIAPQPQPGPATQPLARIAS